MSFDRNFKGTLDCLNTHRLSFLMPTWMEVNRDYCSIGKIAIESQKSNRNNKLFFFSGSQLQFFP